MGNTKIQWTDATWNPVRGCSRVSPGCDKCYAMGQAHRFAGTVNGKPGPFAGLTTIRRGKVDWTGRAVFVPEMLDQPLRWNKPRRIFVNSMSDLFHESLSNEEIAAVFGVMAACPRHTFQVLTKRPKRAAEWFKWATQQAHPDGGPGIPTVCGIEAANRGANVDYLGVSDKWPLSNVHLGVSAEDQKTANERIPLLLMCPAAVRFVSAEPLLAAVNLGPWLDPYQGRACMARYGRWGTCVDCPWVGDVIYPERCKHTARYDHHLSASGLQRRLDWLIVGGESGPGARPFDVQWARSLVEQCRDAGVACFVKQLGAKPFCDDMDLGSGIALKEPVPLKDSKGGDMSEWPEALRVRQFPEVRDA